MEGPYITFLLNKYYFYFPKGITITKENVILTSALCLFGILSAYNAVLMHAYTCLCALCV